MSEKIRDLVFAQTRNRDIISHVSVREIQEGEKGLLARAIDVIFNGMTAPLKFVGVLLVS